MQLMDFVHHLDNWENQKTFAPKCVESTILVDYLNILLNNLSMLQIEIKLINYLLSLDKEQTAIFLSNLDDFVEYKSKIVAFIGGDTTLGYNLLYDGLQRLCIIQFVYEPYDSYEILIADFNNLLHEVKSLLKL